MRVHVLAVGRLRPSPERTLVEDYLRRFDRAGRGLGLGPARVVEVEDRSGRGSPQARESALLDRAVPKGAALCALDPRGEELSSDQFAARLAKWRDAGTGDLAFAIGGAEGLDSSFLAQAVATVSMGPMIWPHALARVMLAEQLYRAATILSGAPYHRA